MIEKLSPENLKAVYEHARRWNEDERLHDPKNASEYLEDRMADCTSDLTTLLTDVIDNEERYPEGYFEQFKRRVLQKSCFFTNVWMRYSQKKTGLPEEMQQIHDYDSQNGNQIDNYLSEFFNV